MQLHQLQRVHKNKKARQVGRGGTRGKTAGRGTKGQKARAGHKMRPEMRDIIKRLPKLRGRGKNSNKSINLKAVVVNLARLEVVFKAGETVSPKTLLSQKVISLTKGKTPSVKILATGELTKKLTIENCAVSGAAREKITKLGGEVNLVTHPQSVKTAVASK